MGRRGFVFAFLLVAPGLLAVLSLAPPPAAASAPSVGNVTWSPFIPARWEQVTVEADVSDPDGLVSVFVSWCVLPPDTCLLYDMTDIGGGRWSTGDAVSVVGPPSHGAYLNVSALDTGGFWSMTPKFYVQFADAITVEASLSPNSVAPGDPVLVEGTAYYSHLNGTGPELITNFSAPARFSSVHVDIVEAGETWSAQTDADGAFSVSGTAPATEGSYTVHVSVTNRTISGSEDRYLVAANVPTPDLAVVAGSVNITPTVPRAGEAVTVLFSVENRGNLLASGFTVRLRATDGAGGVLYERLFPQLRAEPSERLDLQTTFPAPAGPFTLEISVDVNERVGELSETNNEFAVLVAVTSSEGLSTTLIIALVMVGVGAVVVSALVLRRRAGRREPPQ